MSNGHGRIEIVYRKLTYQIYRLYIQHLTTLGLASYVDGLSYSSEYEVMRIVSVVYVLALQLYKPTHWLRYLVPSETRNCS